MRNILDFMSFIYFLFKKEKKKENGGQSSEKMLIDHIKENIT